MSKKSERLIQGLRAFKNSLLKIKLNSENIFTKNFMNYFENVAVG